MLHTQILGWGSTVEAGPKPHKYVPVQIVPPGNVASVSLNFILNQPSSILNITKTGDDAVTLRKIEARIQADLKDGLPPHLQPEARRKEYLPGKDQSRIYLSSHSEFSNLQAKDIQAILRERLILVSGVPIDYNYGWDLESMDRLHDVDKTTNVHGGAPVCFLNAFV